MKSKVAEKILSETSDEKKQKAVNYGNSIVKKKEYIGAFLDGYFSDKKVEFGMQYYSMLNNAIDVAEKKWKKYKKMEKI